MNLDAQGSSKKYMLIWWAVKRMEVRRATRSFHKNMFKLRKSQFIKFITVY